MGQKLLLEQQQLLDQGTDDRNIPQALRTRKLDLISKDSSCATIKPV